MIGSNQEILEWATTNGATSTQWNTALMQACIALGGSAGSLPDMLNAMLIAKGYSGTVSDMWGQLYVDEIAGGGGPPAPAHDYEGVVTIVQIAGTTRGDYTGATIVPQETGILSGGTEVWNRLYVSSSGVLQLRTDGDATEVATMYVTFPDYSATAISLPNFSATVWRVSGHIPVYDWMGTVIDTEVAWYADATDPAA